MWRRVWLKVRQQDNLLSKVGRQGTGLKVWPRVRQQDNLHFEVGRQGHVA